MQLHVLVVDRAQQIVPGRLLTPGHRGWRSQIRDRHRRAAQDHALMRSRQKSIAPQRRATRRQPAPVRQHYEAGQILILAAQPVAHPGADGGEALKDEPRGHLEQRGAMRVGARHHGMNEREIVHHAAQMRQNLRDELAALSVLLECKWRPHHRPAPPKERRDRVGPLRLLSVMLLERGLVVERVHVAEAARQKHHDDVLGLG